MSPIRLLAACLMVAFMAGLPLPARSAWPHEPHGNVPVCTAGGEQYLPVSIPDGTGGTIVTWYDYRGGTGDIYAQRLDAGGNALWTADGVGVCVDAGTQYMPRLVTDGAGGAIVAWVDMRSGALDVYVQRISAAGDVLWSSDGVPLVVQPFNQYNFGIASDGLGGAIVAWQDIRTGANYDIYAQRVNASGAVLWTPNGVAVCTAAGDQTEPELVGDGSGGSIVTWQDLRNGGSTDIYAAVLGSSGIVLGMADGFAVCNQSNAQTVPAIVPDGEGGAMIAWIDARSGTGTDVYAQRVSSGSSGMWTSGGVALCTATGSQTAVALTPDGSGGGIAAWIDPRGASSDVYAQRVLGGGAVAWTANGVPICAATGAQTAVIVTGDGSGSAFYAWSDPRSGQADVYAQRTSAGGVPQWATDGVAVSTAALEQAVSGLTLDGDGRAVAAFQDLRSGGARDIYVQCVDRYGVLGDATPVIAGVRDLANDQGGQVKLTWRPSWLDSDPMFGIADYRIWRSVPAAGAPALRAGRVIEADPDRAAASGRLLLDPSGAQDYYWEYVTLVSAAQLPGYSLVTATTCDSLAGSNPRTLFMLEARASAATGAPHWYSAPDSGYSVDNLAPVAPALLTGQYATGTTTLHWNPNTEADLAGYRLYRGANASFVPGPQNFVTVVAGTQHADGAGAPYVYKLTAVDAHGNESPVATLIPAGTLAVAPGTHAAYFAPASPNPSRGGVTLRFALARAGAVRLGVYDAAGRLVRSLCGGERAAGEHVVEWNGRDDGGRPVNAGLYFARIDSPGLSATRRIVRTD